MLSRTYFIAAPGPPQKLNLSFQAPNEVSAIWLPPSEMNGDLDHYNVSAYNSMGDLLSSCVAPAGTPLNCTLKNIASGVTVNTQVAAYLQPDADGYEVGFGTWSRPTAFALNPGKAR